ncbi:transposase [Streptomyces niger]|uniref:transposase n=1 Tax=Streptomyces niger TaxID=66373 RepID=UPI00069B9A61|nr:transposase [Streptomyces niger]
MLRDIITKMGWPPLIWTRDDGYLFTADPAHLESYETAFARGPRRWIVERSISWWMHARRLVRDYERNPAHAEAMVNTAVITLMSRRLARGTTYPTAAVPRPGNSVQAA